jgi:hypothetical protein
MTLMLRQAVLVALLQNCEAGSICSIHVSCGVLVSGGAGVEIQGGIREELFDMGDVRGGSGRVSGAGVEHRARQRRR